MCVSLQLPEESPYFTPPPSPFPPSCFAESANDSEKPLDAEREKELRAEGGGTDDSDPASPSWALSPGGTILESVPSLGVSHGVCW